MSNMNTLVILVDRQSRDNYDNDDAGEMKVFND